MATDPKKPLAPLAPEDVAHLVAALGLPKSHLMQVSGGRDIYASGWTIGHGEINGGPSRSTAVEIVVTEGGNLITSRLSSTQGTDGVDTDEMKGGHHETPDAAYQWLIKDGRGKLGPASKKAWAQACKVFPPMAGMEFERID